MTRRRLFPADIHPYERRMALMRKHAKVIPGSGMTIEEAERRLHETGPESESLIVVDWLICYEPKDGLEDGCKPFSLHFGKVLDRTGEPEFLEELMMCSSSMTLLSSNSIFHSKYRRYILVGEGGVIEDLPAVISEYLNS